MKLLILSQNYPSNKNIYSQAYIHTRLLCYKQQSVEAEVISFACKSAYLYEGIKVYPACAFKRLIRDNKYDAIVCHAPNLRNHLRLILPNIYKLPKIFFFFHGHEILNKSKYYPKDYGFNQGLFYSLFHKLGKVYDLIKCCILRYIIKKFGGHKIFLVFVSKHLKKLFEINVGLTQASIHSFSAVIHNPLNPIFTVSNYNWSKKKPFDFITIRPFDNPVYALDIILKIAKQNPLHSFHIYGEGNFFDHHEHPRNVKVIKTYFSPKELKQKLDMYKAALMPSYHDSQGVMVCEMAAFGIPLVVSDIPAAREMLGSIKNKYLIDNNKPKLDAEKFLKTLSPRNNTGLKKQLSIKETTAKELAFIQKFIK